MYLLRPIRGMDQPPGAGIKPEKILDGGEEAPKKIDVSGSDGSHSGMLACLPACLLACY
jgi:hypothetical protein